MIHFEIEQGSHAGIIRPSPVVFRDYDTIHIFTDGGCGKNGIGGWACALLYRDNLMIRFGCASGTKSNRMELYAILMALKEIKRGKQDIVIYTDSQYCKNSFTQWVRNWRRNDWINSQCQPVKNRDLIEQIDDLQIELKKTRKLKFEWVKSHLEKSTHINHQMNCMVDRLTVQAKEKMITNVT